MSLSETLIPEYEQRTPHDVGVVRLWSILDVMNVFNIPHLAMVLLKLRDLEAKYFERVSIGQGGVPLTAQEAQRLSAVVNETLEFCTEVGFEEARLKAYGLHLYLTRGARYDASAAKTEMDNLHQEVVKSSYKYVFFQVSQDAAKYTNQEKPFGDAVADAFPSAANDLTEAGNCLAAECNLASVFHLMRAAEVGLWELGRDRQIPLAQNDKIEFTDWGLIIGELETAVKAIQQWPNSRSKENAHKFYNHALVEIRAFNDGWRRHAAHPRPYQPIMESDTALAFWGHVRRFMTTLADHIGEGRYTPTVWE